MNNDNERRIKKKNNIKKSWKNIQEKDITQVILKKK